MRAKDFLLEYNRQITADKVGDNLILALANDYSHVLPTSLTTLRQKLSGISRTTLPQLRGVIPAEKRLQMINAILAEIEAKDPTPNKAYTPWLAKTYAKRNLRIEDINRNDLLGMYDIAKKRKKVKPEHADINRFGSYSEFEDTMQSAYNNFEDLDDKEKPEGKASKEYEDAEVTVVVPHDQAAACRYGRGTRWCTAATRSNNLFNQYNESGDLYIIIPKNPEHEGEKYQIHIPSESFMNEHDKPVNLGWLLEKRFKSQGLKNFLMQAEPNLSLLWLIKGY